MIKEKIKDKYTFCDEVEMETAEGKMVKVLTNERTFEIKDLAREKEILEDEISMKQEKLSEIDKQIDEVSKYKKTQKENNELIKE